MSIRPVTPHEIAAKIRGDLPQCAWVCSSGQHRCVLHEGHDESNGHSIVEVECFKAPGRPRGCAGHVLR